MAMNEGFDLLSRSVAVTSTPVVKTRSNWATVETIDPLTIILDEDTTNTPREVSENAVGRLKVTDRVRFAHEDKRLVITEAPSKVDDLFSLRIPAGANLNSYIIPGQYYNPENLEVAGFTNGPPNSQAGALIVLETSTSPGTGVGVIQYWHDYSTNENGQIWRRRYYNGSWSGWQGIGGELQPGQLVAWGRRADTEDNTVATLDHYMGISGTLYSTRTYLVEVHTPTWWLSNANAVMTMQLRRGDPGVKPTPSSGEQLGRVNLTMGQSTYGAMPGGNISSMVQVSTTGLYYFGLFFAPATGGHTARMYDAIMTITDKGHGQPGQSLWVP